MPASWPNGRRPTRALHRGQRRGRLGDECRPRRQGPGSGGRARCRAPPADPEPRQREQLSLRAPGGGAAGHGAPGGAWRPRDVHRRRHEPRERTRPRAPYRRRAARGLQPRVALGAPAPLRRGRGTRLHPPGGGLDRAHHRGPPPGLAVPIPADGQHAAPCSPRRASPTTWTTIRTTSPFWDEHHPILVLPYALDSNDMMMWAEPAFTPRDWLEYAIDTFDWLWREGARDAPRMMSLGLHLRIVGPRAHRVPRAVPRSCAGREGVWFATRAAIADAWARAYPRAAAGSSPSPPSP